MAFPVAGTVNRVTNPSFETNTTTWSADVVFGASSIARITSGGLFGSCLCRVTAVGTGAPARTMLNSSLAGVNITISQQWSASAWVKTSLTRIVTLQVQGSWGAFPSVSLSCTAGIWTRVDLAFTAASTATTCSPIIVLANRTSGETVDVDGVSLMQVAGSPDYFDGSFADAVWNGTAHASSSTYNGPAIVPGTSAYMPDVKVEIAFDSGYATAAASRTWTDVSSYVELKQGINITHGRGDEFATTDPNKLSITLDNKDGRFTAGKTGSPYYPNVKIGRPIRVTSTPVGGTPSVRFLGYVDEWPTEWSDGTDAYAAAKVTASSRMARLGFDAELGSPLFEQVRNATPAAYYPLTEPEGSTLAYDTINPATTLAIVDQVSTAPAFGTVDPKTLPANGTDVTFSAGSGYLRGDLANAVTTSATDTVLEAVIAWTDRKSVV